MFRFLFISLVWGLLLPLEGLSQQNLVPNYSFEDTITCDFGTGALVYLPPAFIPNSPPWFNAQSSPEHYHQCHQGSLSVPSNMYGYQNAKAGNAYAGCIVYGIYEYVETKLSSPLEPQKKYCVEFYVNVANKSRLAIDAIGAYISKDSILGTIETNPLPYIPQIQNQSGNIISDSVNWELISGEFTANGGEQYITIGNFLGSDSTNIDTLNLIGFTYYYIDDVMVYCCDVANTQTDAGQDTKICIGASTFIGTTLNTNFTYSWKPAEGLSDTTAAQPMVNLAITTTYILTVTDTSKKYSCKNTATDTVTVTVIDCDTLENNAWLPNVFSPNNDNNNDVFRLRGSKINSIQFTIYDRWGEKVFESNDMSNGWDGTYKGESLNPGVFVYYCKVVFEDGTEQVLKGNVTLVR